MSAGEPVRVAVAGAAGRMGRALLRLTLEHPELVLGAAFEAPGHPALGGDAGELIGRPPCGVVLGDDPAAATTAFDVLVDFTRPAATVAHAGICADAGRALVSGTTGLDAAQLAAIDAAARHVPVVFAPNMSVGVNLCYHLIATAARVLGDAADVEITELHHRHKVDAPSGTALRMAEVAAAALGRELDAVAAHGRHGETGERPREQIGIHSLRGGEVVGDHAVLFAGDTECVEVRHRALSRDAFASGALRAARWAVGQPAGRYDMAHVLGLR